MEAEIKTAKQLHEAMKGEVSLEYCEQVVKENLLAHMRYYFGAFEGSIRQGLHNMSEDKMREIVSAFKFICRIEELTQPKNDEISLYKTYQKP